MILKYDFAIIGGGPAGTLCARQLSLAGFKVVVLERAQTIKRKVCGEYLCPSGVSLLKELGLESEVVDHYPAIEGMTIHALNRHSIDASFPAYRGRQKGIAVNREQLDSQFIELAKKSGAKVMLGAEVSEINRQGDQGFELQLACGDKISAKLLVGADGRHSFTARALGLKDGMDASKVALHCHLHSKEVNRRSGQMHIFSDGNYIGVDPTGEHEVNLSLVCDRKLFKEEKSPLALLNRYMRASDHLMASYGEIPAEIKVNSVTPLTNKMGEIVSGSATLIGDASGFLDPLTGEGMFVALWSANALAEEIAREGTGACVTEYRTAMKRYADRKRSFFRHKMLLNTAFQFVIRTPWLIKIIAAFLGKGDRGSIFLGIIGNIYSPLDGVKRLLTSQR
jgi:menaquinone-9 beta-reductase